MADISQINVNNTTYDLKDTTARSSIPTVINDLSDVHESSPSAGEVLVYNGASMVANNGWYNAGSDQIGYDNTGSGLSSSTVGNAITELGTNKTNKSVISTNYSDVESSSSNRYIGGHIIPRRDVIDASHADNGVTGDTVWTGMYVQDVEGRNIGKCALGATETGPLRMELYAQNYNTSGTSLGINYLSLGVDKSSNPTVGIGGDGTKVTHASVKSAWRSALGLGTAATTNSTDYATSDHTHGSITNGGAITGNTALASGDRLVFSDSNDSSKLKRSSITFDGSTDTKCLTQKGTWASFTNTAAPSSINNGTTLPTTSISGSTSGWQSLGSKTLSAGLYLIIYTVRFPAQTSGPFYRNIAVGSATDTILNIASGSWNTVSNTNANYFSAQVSTIVAPSANTTYYFLTQVTGGGTLTVAGRYSIVKLA